MYNNIAHNNCNLFAHNCGDLWIHQLALKGARGVAPGSPVLKIYIWGSIFFYLKCARGPAAGQPGF